MSNVCSDPRILQMTYEWSQSLASLVIVSTHYPDYTLITTGYEVRSACKNPFKATNLIHLVE
ncbi:hypothetical protein N7495_001639 [Penicillium taxi]|uniref:uncharacterized protein n=1 Tax=Penicillium taxi TaxID=168475 RepID=UPI002544E8EF|nr:uncharacterized protein N7495_001639 [Penicillium taxi]KAJ5908957.1 hypothetical protein N7495_001639 [Penicillium taxi]